MPLDPQQGPGGRPAADSGTGAAERAGKPGDGFLQVRRQVGQRCRFGIVEAQKLIRLGLAVAEDREGVRVIAQRLALQVDLTGALGDDRQNGPGFPILRGQTEMSR